MITSDVYLLFSLIYMITIWLYKVFITPNVCSSQDHEGVSTVRRTVLASSTATSG